MTVKEAHRHVTPWVYARLVSTETRSWAARKAISPLRLHPFGMRDPNEQYWGEPGDRVDPDIDKIISAGPRPCFEMEQIVPGDDDPADDGPILGAVALRDSRRLAEARALLKDLLAQDIRCLDAHAHLGNFSFDSAPGKALPHFERGVAIGELSLGEGFTGLLPWTLIDNRPFHRCLHGYGLCLWRLGKFEEAKKVFGSILWLEPADWGALSILQTVRRGGALSPDL